MTKPRHVAYYPNELAFIHYANIGTPKYGVILAKIIENWDHRLYLKPDRKHQCLQGSKTPLRGHLWWNTKM